MDWIKNLVDKKKDQSVKRSSIIKKTSNEKRFHVRTSDKKVLIARKNPKGTGFVYKSKGPSGTRNVHINGNLYKTEEEAKKKVEKLKAKN